MSSTCKTRQSLSEQAVARVSVWIGEIKWMRRNGFEEACDPILKPLDNFECRDVILTPEDVEPDWSEADVAPSNVESESSRCGGDQMATRRYQLIVAPVFVWLLMASQVSTQQDTGSAELKFGLMFLEGANVPQDDAEAVRWFRRAAEQGNVGAQFMLGGMYREGRGVAQDDAGAVTWYRRAADQDFSGAQAMLGTMYRDGRGVPQDDAEAVHWFRRASSQGDPFGQTSLGAMYAKGRGVPQDHTEAARWYRRAAEQGNSDAQRSLGAAYVLGYGVPQDYVAAHMWLNLAGAQGDEDARQLRDDIAADMTATQIAEAQRRAAGRNGLGCR